MSAQPSPEASTVASAREQVQQLLAEVTALAIALRAGKPTTQRGEVPQAGRAVLLELQRKGERTVPELARTRGTSRQNIQTIVNRLRRAGWVTTTENPAHKRSELVSVTASGAAILERSAASEAELLDSLLASVPEADLVSASRAIRVLRRALDQKRWPARVSDNKARRTIQPVARSIQNPDTELPVSLL